MILLFIIFFTSFALFSEISVYQVLNDDDIISNDLSFNILSEKDTYGIQFDLIFDENNILITPDHLFSSLEGIQVWSDFIDNGYLRVLMFSLSYAKLSDSQKINPEEFLKISFVPIDGYKGTTNIQLANLVLAGSLGKEIEAAYPFDSQIEINNPVNTKLGKIFPNPFRKIVTIPYQVSKPGLVKINIFNSENILISTLVENYIEIGHHITIWNGKDALGQDVDSGTYNIIMMSDGTISESSSTITLLK